MPKRILLLAFAVTALALAACNGGINPDDLYGTPVPSASAVPLTPNPNATQASVVITVSASPSASPLAKQAVNLYNVSAAGTATGAPIATQTTDPEGIATFSGLTPTKTYCFTSTYTPPTPPAGSGGLVQNASSCTNLWGAENVDFIFSN
jgi:hypothetical protein